MEDAHTETQAESEAAAARGKGTAVRSGIASWDKLPNIFHFIQVPREQDRTPPVRASILVPQAGSSLSAASKWNNISSPAKKKQACAVLADGEWEEVEEEEEQAPVFRSLADKAPSAITSARLSRGTYAGTHDGVRSKTVVRAKEPCRIQTTIVWFLDSEEPPETSDVKASWAMIQRMVKLAGEAKELMNPEAKLTTGAPLKEEDLMDIVEKQKEHPAPPQVPDMPVAPVVGMVLDEPVAVA